MRRIFMSELEPTPCERLLTIPHLKDVGAETSHLVGAPRCDERCPNRGDGKNRLVICRMKPAITA